MAYETQCGGCTYYDFQGDNYKGYCSWYKCYYYPGDSCSHQNPREQSSSSCYITTIICDKLGYSDDCGVLNILRGFRDNVMQKNCKYCKTLFEYDVIGPKIAEMIKQDNEKDEELWANFYNFYLLQTASLVTEEKYDEAVSRYTEMVNALKEYYGINEDIVEITKDYDMSQGGHGKLKLLERKGEN